MSGIPLSNEKISFTASLQEGWSGGHGSGDKSRAVKPDFPGLAREQKVLTTDEAFSKPLYLHPIETVNKTLKNQGPTTRGTMNFDPVINNFGVSANYIQKAGSGDLFHNQEAKKEGSNWFVAGNKTWPLDGSVSFYAYAPYNDASLSLQGNDAVVKNKTIHYTANTVDLSKQPDLIVAKSESNAFTSSTANKAIGLSFSHALTAITFSISADMIPGTVKSIKVSGVYGQGDYDLSKGKWISWANPSSTYDIKQLNVSVKAGESKALTDKNSALMMIPQDLGPNAKVSMEFNDGKKDNGLIVNTVSQVTNTPNRIAVTINKANYSHHVIKQTGIMNLNCLSTDAPFHVFENFGFQSGRTADKFAGWDPLRSDNGLVFLPKYINSFMSLKVEQYIDLDTHGMFICSITESRVMSRLETMTYNYYQSNVKPKPATEGKKGFVCKVCGYIYEGEELPDDYICPLCKHGVADFEPIA